VAILPHPTERRDSLGLDGMLFVSVLTLWALSYFRADGIRRFDGRVGRGVESRTSGLFLGSYCYYILGKLSTQERL
jgi:hypothetical protein